MGELDEFKNIFQKMIALESPEVQYATPEATSDIAGIAD